MIRTASIISVDPQQGDTRSSTLKITKRKMAPKQVSSDADVNDSATTSEEFHSDSTQSVKKMPLAATNSSIMLAIHDLEQSLQEHGDKISQLQRNINRVLESNMKSRNNPSYVEIMIIIFLLGFFQAVFVYFF
jgi:hypothetical protein